MHKEKVKDDRPITMVDINNALDEFQRFLPTVSYKLYGDNEGMHKKPAFGRSYNAIEFQRVAFNEFALAITFRKPLESYMRFGDTDRIRPMPETLGELKQRIDQFASSGLDEAIKDDSRASSALKVDYLAHKEIIDKEIHMLCERLKTHISYFLGRASGTEGITG